MSILPPAPDFAALDQNSPSTTGQRNVVLGLIGTISFCWSNNESLLIYFIMLLTRTDERTASVIFSTLGTYRARLDLVHKLGALNLQKSSVRNDLFRLMKAFDEHTRRRNELLHCIYGVSPAGEITHLKNMRVQLTKGEVVDAEVIPVDETYIRGMAKSVKALKKINQDMWNLLPRIEESMRASS